MTDPTSPLCVAYQGEPGAFSEEALRAWFGPAATPVGHRDFTGLVCAVASGEVPFGVLPIENTLAGGVGAACDAFLRADVDVVGEIVHPIRHTLWARAGASLSNVRRVLSHPVALAQCRRFLERHPWLEAVPVEDTAGAVRQVAESGSEGDAAVASGGVGARFGLSALASDVQDRADNQTRFWVLRAWEAAPGPSGAPRGPWKTLLDFTTPHRPGALMRVLRALADGGLNLASLDSRPGEEPWTYRFVAELEGRLEGEDAETALRQARSHALTLRARGPYQVLHTQDDDGPPRAARGGGPLDLEELRSGIDAIDRTLLGLLARRRELARRAQETRQREGDVQRDPPREADVIRRAATRARELDLPDEEVRRIMWSVVALCVA